jgi:large subunit ribosomal protein L25
MPSALDSIDVDISALGINESLHVRDIKAGEGVRILADPDATVATIQPPISAEKLEAMLAAAPTAAPEAAAGEPELVKKPKKEGEATPAEAKGKEGGKEAAPKKEAAAPKK